MHRCRDHEGISLQCTQLVCTPFLSSLPGSFSVSTYEHAIARPSVAISLYKAPSLWLGGGKQILGTTPGREEAGTTILPWLLQACSSVPTAGHCQTSTHMQASPCTASSWLSMTIHTLPLAASGGSLCDIGSVEAAALALVAFLLHAQTAHV